ncbi:hypothetical protein QDR37_10445 [Amnibacterium sp. CER49]|uniref:hypothetical protein n=1 Tax=Amnibacterium sp. CER49 TaxID=3039161 RepID=UPI00244C9F93|nr:hypothetical protein [Amnibacterium sp. CER49]MDH2444361.1 hypothetical protein [Amnibacterium sp. CER49]
MPRASMTPPVACPFCDMPIDLAGVREGVAIVCPWCDAVGVLVAGRSVLRVMR